MRYAIIIFVLIIALFWKACDVLFPCGYRVASIVDSPFHDKSVVMVAQNCGATTRVIGKYYIVDKQFAHSLDKKEKKQNDLPFWKNFANIERGVTKIEWVSKKNLTIRYRNTAEFFGRKLNFQGINITYSLETDDPLLVQNVIDACPTIIDDLWGNEPNLKLDLILKSTKRADKMMHRTNYWEMVGSYGKGTDFICTAFYQPFTGRRVVVRVSENVEGQSIKAVLAEEWNTAIYNDPPKVIWRG